MGNWNSSSGTGTTDDAWSSGPGQNYSSTTTSSSTDNGNDNNDFFSGTFDNPGEPGFSGPSYAGQYGTDSDGTYYGSGDVGEDSELDKISAQFEMLDKIQDTGFNFNKDYAVMDAYGNIRGFDPRGGRYGADDAAFFSRAIGEYGIAGDIYSTVDRSTGFGATVRRGFEGLANGIAERFGTSMKRDYTVLPGAGYVGEVFEDYSATDAIGNVIGMLVPGGARVDRYMSRELTSTGKGAMAFGEGKAFYGAIDTQYAMTPAEEEAMFAAQRAADEAERARGGSDPASQVASTVTGTVTRPGSAILGGLLGDTANPAYNIVAPYTSDAFSYFTSGVSDYFGFVEGGQVPGAQMGGQQEAVTGPVGFVGGPPEQMTDAETVADDVPVEVQEGAYVLNAAAVEYMGSADVKNMILDAMRELKAQGVDKVQDVDKIELDTQVSLLVSKGEVLIPPQVAEVIGYDRLEKINKRGLRETQKRVEENGQSPEAEALDQEPQNPAEGMAAPMVDGGVAEKLRDDLAYSYGPDPDASSRIIKKAQEKNPREFAAIQEANTKEKTEALNRIQFESEEILSKSPEFLRKFDSYLLDQAPYYLQIAYGTENQDEIPLGEPGDFYNEPEGAMGITTGDRTRAYYPGNPEFEDTTYLHETGHTKFPYKTGTLDRAYSSFAALANKLGIGVTPEDQPDDENAVTTLDLYRGLSNSDEKEIRQAVGYLMRQHDEIPGTPTLRNEDSIDVLKERALRYVFDIADASGEQIMSQEERQNLADDMERVFNDNRDVIKKYVDEYGTARLRKAPGGFISAQGRGSSGPNQTNMSVEAEYQGDGFMARPRVNYSEQKNTTQFPDGVVVNEKGKNIGFAFDGQMFLSDDKSLRAGFERQGSSFKGSAKLPEQYGGETVEFGGGSKMKRYNMGATFGPVDIDVSKTQVPQGEDVLGGSMRYRFSENGDVTLEATDDGRSGRIGLNYRF